MHNSSVMGARWYLYNTNALQKISYTIRSFRLIICIYIYRIHILYKTNKPSPVDPPRPPMEPLAFTVIPSTAEPVEAASEVVLVAACEQEEVPIGWGDVVQSYLGKGVMKEDCV